MSEEFDKLQKLYEEESRLISAVVNHTKQANTTNFELERVKKEYEKKIEDLIHKKIGHNEAVEDFEKKIDHTRIQIRDIKKQMGIIYE